MAEAVKYRQFRIRHPEYDADTWALCRAFYAGGTKLLKDESVMEASFPPHLNERDRVYKERKKRAFYIPYAGEIVNSICAGLFQDDLELTSEGADPYFENIFFDDCSPPGGRPMTFKELLKKQVLTALLCRRSWTLVDLPSFIEQNPDGTQNPFPESELEQQELGLLDAYACPVDPEMVLDWEENEDGELEWALVLHKTQRRTGIQGNRGMIREEYTVYTREDWTRYAIEYEATKAGEVNAGAMDNVDVPVVAEGPHYFGRVPLVRLELDDGVWAMGKILPIAIAHFNLRNALSWAEYKSLFPVLVTKKQGMDPENEITHDPDRDINQVWGQGYVYGMAEKDSIEFVGPDSSPFNAAMEDLSNLRDEMHRVLHQMAMSIDNSGAALQRSGDSKALDQAATAVILRALSQVVKEHAIDVLEMAQAGRDEEPTEWVPEGMEAFDETSVDSLMNQASIVDTISIPSATFKVEWAYQLARRLVGGFVDDEAMEDIKKELEENITNEMFDPMMGAALAGKIPLPGEEEDEEEIPSKKLEDNGEEQPSGKISYSSRKGTDKK